MRCRSGNQGWRTFALQARASRRGSLKASAAGRARVQLPDGLVELEPAPGRGRQPLLPAAAFLALALFTLWGLGLDGWPLALAFGLGAAGLVALLAVLIDRTTRFAARLFLSGLRDAGVPVRAARCRADRFGYTKAVEFATPLGTGWVRGDSRSVEWLAPGAPAGSAHRYARLWRYSPHGPTVGRFTLDDWRTCMRLAGRTEGRLLLEGQQGAPPPAASRQGFPPRAR